jgi:hypothetical protein
MPKGTGEAEVLPVSGPRVSTRVRKAPKTFEIADTPKVASRTAKKEKEAMESKEQKKTKQIIEVMKVMEALPVEEVTEETGEADEGEADEGKADCRNCYEKCDEDNRECEMCGKEYCSKCVKDKDFEYCEMCFDGCRTKYAHTLPHTNTHAHTHTHTHTLTHTHACIHSRT